MSITINPGNSFLIIFGIILAVVIVLMLLRPGQTDRKVLSLVIMIAAFAVVYFVFGRPSTVLVDEAGIHSTTYGKIELEWSDIRETKIVDDYRNTDWRPSAKINGAGMGGFKTGRYRLSGGSAAWILTQSSDRAVIFITDDQTYLFALDETDKLIETASKYIAF